MSKNKKSKAKKNAAEDSKLETPEETGGIDAIARMFGEDDAPEDDSADDADTDDSDDTDDLGPTDEDLEVIEAMRNLIVSESSRVQDERKNTPTGEIKNQGRTDEYIEIVIHRHPAVEAGLRGIENADKETGVELPEGQEPAPTGADYKSGNSITGATRPAPFAPWDDAKKAADKETDSNPPAESIAAEAPAAIEEPPAPEKLDEDVKEELVANQELAGQATTAEGQLDPSVEPIDTNNAAEDAQSKVSQ